VSDIRQPENELDEVFLEYLRRMDQAAVDPEEFLAAHEHLAGDLRELIATAARVEQMAGPMLGSGVDRSSESSHIDAASAETVVVPPGTERNAGQSGSGFVGTSFGNYQILEELGRGGMGVVYKARQTGMARDVALKMIRSGRLAAESDVQRFYLEAKAAGRLNHHSIVDVYEVGEIDGHHFFSMEYVAGCDLARYAKQHDLSFSQIAKLIRQVVEAVDFAHQHGVLHRDLKPSNILVDAEGCPRITDFGLAKDLESGDQLTSSGSTLGTPSYMPPEQAQARRDEITCRSDVYSLGAILYVLLTGRPPFRADSHLDTLIAVIEDDPVPPRQHSSECPPDLEAICLKCLQKDPAARYATAQEMAEDLTQFIRGESVTARRSRLHRRVWRWLRNVPLVAALLGRKRIRPTPWQVRGQWIAVAVALAAVAGILAWPGLVESRRLATVDISTGPASGKYFEIGQAFAARLSATTEREVQALETAGSVDGHDRLLAGDADLAFLQENVSQAHGLKVLAPLYREVILVLVRRESGITTVPELTKHHISLGPPGSGMRFSSQQLLRHYHVPEEDLYSVNRPYTDLAHDGDLEGAIVTIRLDALRELAASGDYRLLPLEQAPGFRVMQLQEEDLPGLVPSEGALVPATFAILAVREQSPEWFVNDCLDALYGAEGLAAETDAILSLEEAAAWPTLSFHTASERFFRAARGVP